MKINWKYTLISIVLTSLGYYLLQVWPHTFGGILLWLTGAAFGDKITED